MLVHLLGHQVARGDIELLVLGVTRDADHLETVEQRRRDVQRVGCGHEHYLGQVEIDFQVMVVEAVVLLGIEHFQQRR